MAKVLARAKVPTQLEAVEDRKSFDILTRDPSNEHFVLGRESGARVPISKTAFETLLAVLDEISNGHAVYVVPVHAELSTFEAAELLGVSRPHLIKVLEEGAIPFRVVGRHRRIRFDDLLAYKECTQQRRLQALREITAADDEMFGMGD